jgi:hypothetical protein
MRRTSFIQLFSRSISANESSETAPLYFDMTAACSAASRALNTMKHTQRKRTMERDSAK